MVHTEFIESLIKSPPKLHYWENRWHEGGFHESHIRCMIRHLAPFTPGFSLVETGAGQSTALFLALGAKRVVSVAPDKELFDRIRQLCAQGGVSAAALEAHVDFSERALPAFAFANEETFDAALIDGGHGWPTVFVDFCYMNMALRPGGLLMVDDVQLHAVQELLKLLLAQPLFEFLEQRNKLTFFRKKWKQPMLPDFGGQPYIAKMPPYPLVDRVAGAP